MVMIQIAESCCMIIYQFDFKKFESVLVVVEGGYELLFLIYFLTTFSCSLKRQNFHNFSDDSLHARNQNLDRMIKTLERQSFKSDRGGFRVRHVLKFYCQQQQKNTSSSILYLMQRFHFYCRAGLHNNSGQTMALRKSWD